MKTLSLETLKCHYTHLTLGERHEISALLVAGWSVRAIAGHLRRSVSTLSRELSRCKGSYDPVSAHDNYLRTREPSNGRDWVLYTPAGELLKELLQDLMEKKRRSVAQALLEIGRGVTTAAQLARSIPLAAVYRWIERFRESDPDAIMLNQAMIRPNRRRGAPAAPRGSIPGLVSIDERPAEAATREVPGHWEGDLIFGVGSKTVLLTLVDRCTRVTRILSPGSKKASEVLAALTSWAVGTTDPVETITWDRGSEMWSHQEFTEITKVPVFFCDPHAPWQRPSNENTNGVLRRFHPKGTALVTTPENVAFLETCLNTRPMRVLSWETPEQVLASHCSAK